jgi:hypothetical protein
VGVTGGVGAGSAGGVGVSGVLGPGRVGSEFATEVSVLVEDWLDEEFVSPPPPQATISALKQRATKFFLKSCITQYLSESILERCQE